MNAPLKWKRSDDGYTETWCEHYSIEPIFAGRTKPISYRLFYQPGTNATRQEIGRGYIDTHRVAKIQAEVHWFSVSKTA